MSNPDLSTLPIVTSPSDFECWLEQNGDSASEYWFAIHKKTSPNVSVSLEELIDVAICFGWIDVKGIRVDEQLRGLRFTPRRANSNWSAINRQRARQLVADGRMRASGIACLPDDF